MTSAEVGAGGNAVLDMNAGATVYGAMVVQGKVDKANGTAAIIHDDNVPECDRQESEQQPLRHAAWCVE
jgi:hypothetical protein